jgi:glucose-6-phosphate dehydrogenase assembly protein OpcA
MTSEVIPLDAPAVVVRLRDVESELSRLVKEIVGPKVGPIQRARMSNLVIYCDTEERANQVENHVGSIVALHPARVILLIALSGTGNDATTASVRVTHAGVAGRQLCEQVKLKAEGSAVGHLPFALRELLIGDLPTNLWWASATPPALAGPLLIELAENAEQILFDSLDWLDRSQGIASTDLWLDKIHRPPTDSRGWRIASDLNWRRARIWRRILAEGLSPATAPGVLEAIIDIEILHGPHALTQAWELVAWMASRLGWAFQSTRFIAGESVTFQFVSQGRDVRIHVVREPEAPPSIHYIGIRCAEGTCDHMLEFRATGDSRISFTPLNGEAFARTVATSSGDLAELVGYQLSSREPDDLFRQTMRLAHLMAKGLEA